MVIIGELALIQAMVMLFRQTREGMNALNL
jgi:hypothetical protein